MIDVKFLNIKNQIITNACIRYGLRETTVTLRAKKLNQK